MGLTRPPSTGRDRNSWGRRVVRLWEAFLLQMNDFDRFLDLQLRRMLDPVVATPAPPRTSPRPRPRQPILAIEGPIERAPDVSPIEPGVLTVPVAPAQV